MEKSDAEQNASLCGTYDHYSTLRFSLIMAASALALSGVVTNLCLAWIFVRLTKAKSRWNTSHLYLITLVLCDALLCFGFCVMFGLDALSLYLRMAAGFALYFKIVLIVFTISRFVQLSIPYLIIIATIERWLLGSGTRFGCISKRITTDSTRYVATSAICFFALGFRLPTLWAFEVHEFPECTDPFKRKMLYPTPLTANRIYQAVDFYLLSALQVFVPFAILTSLNLAIIRNIESGKDGGHNFARRMTTRVSRLVNKRGRKREPRKRSLAPERKRSPNPVTERRQRLREATITMAVIVSSYLLCSTPHFVLTIMEQLNLSLLESSDGGSSSFYMIYSDLVSVLFMFNSFLRSLIFCKFNHEVRAELALICGRKREMAPGQSRQYGATLPERIGLPDGGDVGTYV